MMKKFYKIIAAIFTILFIAVCANAGQEFVGSKSSNKYHYPTCKWVKEIKPHKIIKFNSPEEATKAGYIPCPTCHPPLPVPDKTTNDKVVKNSDGNNSKKAADNSYTLNIVLSSLLLLLLFFVPFLSGLVEIFIKEYVDLSELKREKFLTR